MSDQPTARCPGCGVPVGTAHQEVCGIARCLWTGTQKLACGRHGAGHDCGQDAWTGEWPGVREALALGWTARWSGAPSAGGVGWVPCDPSHPDAQPDLNRLVTQARWDRKQQQWIAPQPPRTPT